MVEAAKITADEAEAARRLPLGLKGKGAAFDVSDAPYFIDYLTGSWKISTTIAWFSLQIASDSIRLSISSFSEQPISAVTKHMAAVEKMPSAAQGRYGRTKAASVAMKPKTAEILRWSAERDYAASQLNRANRCPSSARLGLPTFVYAAALSQTDELARSSRLPRCLLDAPHTFEYGFGKTIQSGNFGDKYEMKQITLRDRSREFKNVITVELAERVGFSQVARLAERAGLPKVPTFPSWHLVSVKPRRCRSPPRTQSLRIAAGVSHHRDQTCRPCHRRNRLQGRDREPRGHQPQVAYVMTSLLEDVIDHGTGSRVRQWD
jgi:membrane peptidoglycan carboxypeptidase